MPLQTPVLALARLAARIAAGFVLLVGLTSRVALLLLLAGSLALRVRRLLLLRIVVFGHLALPLIRASPYAARTQENGWRTLPFR